MIQINRTVLAHESDWTFSNSANHIFWHMDAIGLDGPENGDVAALTGDAVAAFDAAVPDNQRGIAVFHIFYVDDPTSFEFRSKGGDWETAVADGTSPVCAPFTSGSGSGFEVRGNGLSGNGIIRITDICLSY